jgi:hypothetical protein
MPLRRIGVRETVTMNDWMIVVAMLVVVISLRSAIEYQNELDKIIEAEELENERLKKLLAEAEEQIK